MIIKDSRIMLVIQMHPSASFGDQISARNCARICAKKCARICARVCAQTNSRMCARICARILCVPEFCTLKLTFFAYLLVPFVMVRTWIFCAEPCVLRCGLHIHLFSSGSVFVTILGTRFLQKSSKMCSK